MRGALTVAGVTSILLVAGSGCSSSAVDSACDVDGITTEVSHMVEESKLTLSSLDGLSCSGSWAVATATTAGEGQAGTQSTFIFEKNDAGWFLKSPEIACGGDPGMDTIPTDLQGVACPSP